MTPRSGECPGCGYCPSLGEAAFLERHKDDCPVRLVFEWAIERARRRERAVLRRPTDVLAANNAWGAACGPAALAALLGLEVQDTYRFLGSKRWATPTDIQRALAGIDRVYATMPRVTSRDLPKHGLAFIQYEGPWLEPGVPVGAAYQRTHWIAVHGDMAYDINVGESGGWVALDTWIGSVVPMLVEATPRATGWNVRLVIEVRP